MAIKIWGTGSTGGSDGQWDTATNWDSDTLPVDGDSLLFDGTALAPLTGGPASSVVIENIEINSGVDYLNGGLNMGGTIPLIVFGQLINNNPLTGFTNFLIMIPYGVTSIVGWWDCFIGYDPSRPLSAMYIGIDDWVIDSTISFLNMRGTFQQLPLFYGTSDASLTPPSNPTDNFNSITIENCNLGSGAWIITGTTGLNADQLIFNADSQVECFQSSLGYFFNCPLVEFNGPFTSNFFNNTSLSGDNSITFVGNTVLNVNSYNNFTPINSTSFGDYLSFIFSGLSTINLYDSVIFGSRPNSSNGGLALIQSNSSVTLNAYQSSVVCGCYNEYRFVNSNDFGAGVGSQIVNMFDDSIFQGIIRRLMGPYSINFYDNSNLSVEYDILVGSFTGLQIQYQNYTIGTSTGLITKTFVFKSSF